LAKGADIPDLSATVALDERNLSGVIGIVNFAGGNRDEKCGGWENSLVSDY
jgi:hypothetical protein